MNPEENGKSKSAAQIARYATSPVYQNLTKIPQMEQSAYLTSIPTKILSGRG